MNQPRQVVRLAGSLLLFENWLELRCVIHRHEITQIKEFSRK